MRNVLIGAAIVAFTALSFAVDRVAKSDNDWIRLSDSPCTHAGTLGHLKPEYRDKFKRARAQLGGQDWFACWTETPNGDYFVLFEDGDQIVIPKGAFKEDHGV